MYQIKGHTFVLLYLALSTFFHCISLTLLFQCTSLEIENDTKKISEYNIFTSYAEIMHNLPRSQTSLSLRKGWARKGGREFEGERPSFSCF